MLRLVVTAAFGAMAYWLFPSGIFSTSIAQATIGQILCLVGSAFFGVITVSALFGTYE